MKLWKLLPVLASLLLVGCENKPFMDLDFDVLSMGETSFFLRSNN